MTIAVDMGRKATKANKILRREGLWHAILGQTSRFLKDKLSQNMNANYIYILNKVNINLLLSTCWPYMSVCRRMDLSICLHS